MGHVHDHWHCDTCMGIVAIREVDRSESISGILWIDSREHLWFNDWSEKHARTMVFGRTSPLTNRQSRMQSNFQVQTCSDHVPIAARGHFLTSSIPLFWIPWCPSLTFTVSVSDWYIGICYIGNCFSGLNRAKTHVNKPSSLDHWLKSIILFWPNIKFA